jgi:SAM-dependent methyltransferase
VTDFVRTDTSDVYYQGQYWNDLPEVIEHLSECFTGDRGRWWVIDFRDRFCETPFQRGLFLNCGNGWVEREFIDRQMVQSAVAFDHSHKLLTQAEHERGDRAITYFQADCNAVGLEPASFDLVVNVAALHHVQYLNRLCRQVRLAMREDGVFLNYDYVGPSRNQYSLRHWWRIRAANRALSPNLRKPRLRYPHLATMLVMDPTEAIHSSLIMDTVARYFEVVEHHDGGGGLAYDLLTNNPSLASVAKTDRVREVRRLLARDRELTLSGKVPPFFTYFIARPRQDVLDDTVRLAAWQAEEDERERRAAGRGSVYTNLQYLKLKRQHAGSELLRLKNRWSIRLGRLGRRLTR